MLIGFCRQVPSLRALPHVTFEEIPHFTGPNLEDINELQEWDNLEEEYSVSFVLLICH